MRFWVGVGSALGLGGILGFATAYAVLEERLYKKYEESLDEMQGVYEGALREAIGTEPPPETVDHLADGVILQTNEITTVKDGDIGADYTPATTNPYWTAPPEPTIDTDANYQISYIEPEDFEEEDGRLKQQIEVMMDDANPIFTMDGEQLYDWDDRVGPTIVQDLITMTPPGQQQVLYVRNHKTDVDYEVMRVSP